jgi:hypothetical protein
VTQAESDGHSIDRVYQKGKSDTFDSGKSAIPYTGTWHFSRTRKHGELSGSRLDSGDAI